MEEVGYNSFEGMSIVEDILVLLQAVLMVVVDIVQERLREVSSLVLDDLREEHNRHMKVVTTIVHILNFNVAIIKINLQVVNVVVVIVEEELDMVGSFPF